MSEVQKYVLTCVYEDGDNAAYIYDDKQEAIRAMAAIQNDWEEEHEESEGYKLVERHAGEDDYRRSAAFGKYVKDDVFIELRIIPIYD